MKIEHKRIANVKRGDRAYCISHVYVNGVYSHDTIEDYDRGLNQSMTEAQARAIKVATQTAIPVGTYTVKMNITSAKFSQKAYYAKFCKGKMPRLDPVVGFAGILIHCGTTERSSAGCIIVGRNKIVGAVTDSQAVFESLYKRMKTAHDAGETITYTITRKYNV